MLKGRPYACLSPTHHPQLTAEHRSKRIAFCQRHLHADYKNWVFVDAEKAHKSKCGRRSRSRQYMPCKHRTNQLLPKGLVQFYGAVCDRGMMPLVFIPAGGINSSTYCDFLSQLKVWADGLYGGQPWVLIRDNAQWHASKKTCEYMTLHGITALEFPALSPDLNIIENCWGELDRALQAGAMPRTLNDLKQKAGAAWGGIGIQFVRNCLATLSTHRMQAIISGDGEQLQGY
jgi:hypothetical protein